MNIKETKFFTSDFIDFCKEIRIDRENKELVPMEPIPELDINQHDIDGMEKFTMVNPVIERSYYPPPEDCVKFSGYEFFKMGYKKPEGFKAKDEEFIPTWIFAAMILTRIVKHYGAKSVIDLFAGEGRIQKCARLIGMESSGVEYSGILVNVQKQITKETGVELRIIQGDALKERDYRPFCLEKPAFFISTVRKVKKTLDCLVSSLEKYNPEMLQNSLFVTFHLKDEYHLKERCSLVLPTYWGLKTFYHISDLDCNSLKR